MKFKVILVSCEEGGFAVTVPALPGCFSQGETQDEALENIKEAIELHLEPVEPIVMPDHNEYKTMEVAL